MDKNKNGNGLDVKATNIRLEEDGDDLIIRINLKKNVGPSKSGKNTLVASSKGNHTLSNGMTLGLNLYK